VLEVHEEESPGEPMTDQSLWRLEGCRIWHCLTCRRIGVAEAESKICKCLHCAMREAGQPHPLEVFFVPAWAVSILSYEFAQERSKEAKETRAVNP